jgi:hypothetical protein
VHRKCRGNCSHHGNILIPPHRYSRAYRVRRAGLSIGKVTYRKHRGKLAEIPVNELFD